MSVRYYHGGVPGLRVGYRLVPSPPHVTDGCPVCVARAEGRVATVGDMRAWAHALGPRGSLVLASLEGAPNFAPVDPPSAKEAVYVTTDPQYATWYAARSRGDLYEVKPLGELQPSGEDHFAPSFTVEAAAILLVLRRRVSLSLNERYAIGRRWRAADQALAVPA